ncbi:hypothetical protein D1872_330440 [compost metagenome]
MIQVNDSSLICAILCYFGIYLMNLEGLKYKEHTLSNLIGLIIHDDDAVTVIDNQ